MHWLRRARFRLRTLFGRAALEQQLDEELQFHLEMQVAANVRLGMSMASAQALARTQFGSVEQHKDDYRDRWGARHLEAFVQDFRTGLRSAWAQPGLSLAMIVALALGIGVSTAVFSVFHSVLIHPLPYADAGRLVRLRATIPSRTEDRLFSAAEVRDLRAKTSSFDGVAEFHFMYFILLDHEQPQRVAAGVVSANFFTVAGVSPLLGRVFTPAEERFGGANAIILSYRYWQRAFRGDPAVIGHVVQMNDHDHTIVGVLPQLPDFPEEADIYLPTVACPLRASAEGESNRSLHLVSALGRLRTETPPDMQAVTADLRRVTDDLVREHPADYAGPMQPTLSAAAVEDELTRGFRPTLSVLVASAAFLFLSLCSSIWTLMLASALRRRRRLAMQAALGAWRGRLFRQSATETLLLSLMGAIAGVFVASLMLPPLIALASRYTVRASEIHLDQTSLLFAAALGGLATLLLGLVPTVAVVTPFSRLIGIERDREASSARHPFFRGLVVVQIAVSFSLLVGAALTLRSVVNLERIHTGYEASDVTTFRVSTDFFKYVTTPSRVTLFERLRDSLAAEPGVETVSISGAMPLTGSGNLGEGRVEARTADGAAPGTIASLQVISPRHFATIGLRILQGRDFIDADDDAAAAVVIVNSALAHRYWGEASAIGRQIRIGQGEWLTIVGVSANGRQRLNRAVQEEVFRPMRQLPTSNGLPVVDARFFVRSTLASEQLEALIFREVSQIDPHQPIDRVMTLEHAREQSVAPFRLTATVIALFALVGLAISTVGVGGVVGTSVSSRTQEFGVRLALGATRRELLLAVLREGALLSAWGVGFGAFLALLLSRALRSLLFEVPAHDVVSFASVAALLVLIILAACLVPARRAATVDPQVALRVG